MQTVPLKTWPSYVHGARNAELAPRRYEAQGYPELIHFLLDGRCDYSQVAAVMHMHDLLALLEPHKPTLLRIHGDIVRFPRQTVRGRSFVLVHAGIGSEIIKANAIDPYDITPRGATIREHIDTIRSVTTRNTRILLEAADEDGPLASFMLRSSGSATQQPYIDLADPHAPSLLSALEQYLDENGLNGD